MGFVKQLFNYSLLVFLATGCALDFPGVPDVVFAAKNTGGIEYTNDNGGSVQVAGTEEGLTGTVVRVLATGGTHIFALTVVSGIFRSEDGGNSFEQINTFSSVNGFAGFWGDRIFFIGQGSGIYSDDLGDSFTTFPLSNQSTGWQAFVGNGNFLLSDGGLNLYSVNKKGTSFTPLTGLDVSSINNLYGNGDKLLVSTASGLYRSSNGGGSWDLVLSGQNVSAAAFFKGQLLAMAGGTLYQTGSFGGTPAAVNDAFTASVDGLNPVIVSTPPYIKFAGAGDTVALVSASHYCFTTVKDSVEFPLLCAENPANNDVFVAEGFLDLGRGEE